MKKLLILGILLIASTGCGEISIKENTSGKAIKAASTANMQITYKNGPEFNIKSNNVSENGTMENVKEVTVEAENPINTRIGIDIKTNDFKNENVKLILTIKRNGEIFNTSKYLDLLEKIDVNSQKGFAITKREGSLPIYEYTDDDPINDKWEFTITLISNDDQKLSDKDFVAEIKTM